MSSAASSVVAGIDQAERLWKQGDLVMAFAAYRQAVHATLASAENLSAADVVALERFADLAVLLGETEAAMQALSTMADLCEAAGNAYGKDYAVLKAVLAAHQDGQIRRALELMYSLAGHFGDIDAIEFKPAALTAWETTVRWPMTDADDRAVIFALFYLAASRLAASLGQYEDATQAARGGIAHAARNTPLARRYRVPLLLAEALAAVQSGRLGRGSALLDDVAAQSDAHRDPGLNLEFLELSAKLAMLRGDLGAALDRLNKAVESAARWTARVQAACLQNLAAFQILINQTANAEQTLDAAAARVAASDVPQLERIARLRLMADLRARSYAEDSSGFVSSVWELEGDAEDVQPDSPSHTGEPVDQPADFLAWFEQRTLDFQLALGKGRVRLAAQMLSALNDTFAGTDSEVVRLRLAYLETLLVYYLGQHARADALLSPLLPMLEHSGLLHDLWQAQRLAGWIARRVHVSRAAIDAAIAAENSTLSSLAASLDPVSQAIFLLNKWTAEEEAIASLADKAIRDQCKPRSRFAPLRWWHTLQTWRNALAVENRLEAGKRALAASAVGATGSATRSVRLLDLWRQPRTKAHLTFSALPDRLIAIVRSGGAARVHVLEISRIRLRQCVREWHERMLDPSTAPGKGAIRFSPLSAVS